MRRLLLTWLLALALGLLELPTPVAVAQPLTFGSADDPVEQVPSFWWKRERSLDLQGGLSLIAAQWRSAASASFNSVTSALALRLSGTVRAGLYGTYRPDIDDPYDVVRLLSFARYAPTRGAPFYVRLGPLERTRLGTGHLVNFFNTQIAWDDRTVGLESTWEGRLLEVAVFTEDLRLGGVTGGRLALTPLLALPDLRLSTLQLGFNMVLDRSTYHYEGPKLLAYNADIQFEAVRRGAIAFSPFFSYAWFAHQGRGIHFGADLASNHFIDVARFRFRIALHYNGKGFIPDYFGTFYTVHNPQARILHAVAPGEAGERLEGVALERSPGGNDLVTEIRILFFRRFEFWYYFRRHYSSHSLSEYHLRLYMIADRFRLVLGQDRGGLTGFFSLFSELGDRSAMVFQLESRLLGPLWLNLKARYSYERIATGPDGGDRYLVQRRFEPFTGLRFTF